MKNFLSSNRRVACLAIGCAVLALGMNAQGADFDRPLTIVVPFPPGGTTDIVARAVAEGMSRELKQTVVVENRAGAGGNVGAEVVSRAKPDGHTLLVSTAGPLSINKHLYKKLGAMTPSETSHL